jgi:hypothetical protein
MPTHPRRTAAEPATAKRKPGRPKKGLFKVLVSLTPEQAKLLKLSAYVLAAFEGRPFDYSGLLRDILQKSEEFNRISAAVTGAIAAINVTPGTAERFAEVHASPPDLRPDQLRDGSIAAALRDSLMMALRPENRVRERLSEDDAHQFTELLLLLEERARERREAETARLLDEEPAKIDRKHPAMAEPSAVRRKRVPRKA